MRYTWRSLLFMGFGIFLALSLVFHFAPGESVAVTFVRFAQEMLLILPPAFLLIGLFEVWVDRTVVERAFGMHSGVRGYAWALLLAATTTGGSYVAFPVASSLYKKGGALPTILLYVGAAAIVRIPMTLFEASFLGIKFTLVRFAVSLPLLVFVSALLGRYLARTGYNLPMVDEVS